jgi:hypothetical protein
MPTTLKPALIPGEILALNSAKLPEKLLLALYADQATPVRRAIGMTNAGFEKLKKRLIQKNLLSFENGRHVVHVPDFRANGGHPVSHSAAAKIPNKVALSAPTTTQAKPERPLPAPGPGDDDHPGKGYFVANSSKAKTAKKMASPTATRMQATAQKSPAMGTVSKKNSEIGHFIGDSEPPKSAKILASPKSKATQANEIKLLLVPGELLACKYLTAAEKVLLARYTADPGAQNRQVTIGLGISASGLKSLKHDLIAKKVPVPTDEGFTIRLPNYVLVREDKGGHFIPEIEATKNGYKTDGPPLCAVVQGS